LWSGPSADRCKACKPLKLFMADRLMEVYYGV